MNLVRNINDILSELSRELSVSTVPHPDSYGTSGTSDDSSEDSYGNSKKPPTLKFKEKHRVLQLRLGPLRRIQTDLEYRLGAASTEPHSTDVKNAAPFAATERRALQEFTINSNNGWKTALDKFRSMRASSRPDVAPGSLRKLKDKEDEISDVIAGCRDDMKALWEDTTIREMLGRRKSRVEDSPGL